MPETRSRGTAAADVRRRGFVCQLWAVRRDATCRWRRPQGASHEPTRTVRNARYRYPLETVAVGGGATLHPGSQKGSHFCVVRGHGVANDVSMLEGLPPLAAARPPNPGHRAPRGRHGWTGARVRSTKCHSSPPSLRRGNPAASSECLWWPSRSRQQVCIFPSPGPHAVRRSTKRGENRRVVVSND